jgi:NAD(P)-dependent dehydrogenase (short-subunit alcohol dehydrogenase family)
MSPAKSRSVFITGASAGVGRATAQAFARRGWNVALLARDPSGLESTRNEVEQVGGRALTYSTDVADADAVFAAADDVVRQWGAIDVWINNAMVTTFSAVSEMTPAEFRRVTEVTYLGYVFGTMAALIHMRERNAGTIVQVGSALSYRSIPLQSAYCGAKFAVRGFTDSLRSELQHERSAIRLTMVQLPAVNTPQFEWARNKMPKRPQPVPPIHQPEVIAEAVYRASQQAPREVWVGLASVKAILGAMIIPAALDRHLARIGYEGQLSSEDHASDPADNLFRPVTGGHATHGRFEDRALTTVQSFSPPVVRTTILLSSATAVFAVAILALLLLV